MGQGWLLKSDLTRIRDRGCAIGTDRLRRRAAPISKVLIVVGAGGALSGSLTGCLVGPDYRRPETPATTVPFMEQKGLATGAPELDRWWDGFDDPTLQELMSRVLSGNYSLKASAASVLAYRASVGITTSRLFPNIDAGASYSRRQVDPNDLGVVDTFDEPFNSWSAGLTLATWEIDLWGKIRRGIQSSDAKLAASVDDWRNSLVSLRAETASGYITVRTLQDRLHLLDDAITNYQETLELVSQKVDRGTDNQLTLDQVQAQLDELVAKRPTIEADIARSINSIGVLTGAVPQDVHPLLDARKPIPHARPEMNAGVPADLLRRRADVRMAEEAIIAENAMIGAREADLLPALSLSGTIYLTAGDFSTLFNDPGVVYSAGPSIRWNIFNGLRTLSEIEKQKALTQKATYNYQQAVLTAVTQVQTAASNYRLSCDSQRKYIAAAASAERAYRLSEQQFKAGIIPATTMLEDEQRWISMRDQVAQATGLVASNLVEFYRSLGGGWEYEPASVDPPSTIAEQTPAQSPQGPPSAQSPQTAQASHTEAEG